jgi:N-acetylglutamate synthase-like GNAT family acetyltransferase
MTPDLQLEIRAFDTRDREACLRLFESNMPQFFAPYERDEFEEYLTEDVERGPISEYLVLEADGKTVACGGYCIAPDGTAELFWGLVGRDQHREGFGTQLLLERLRRIARVPNASEVILDTTQFSSGFFERFGFEVVQITPDWYGAGLDRVSMRLELNRDARANLLETP